MSSVLLSSTLSSASRMNCNSSTPFSPVALPLRVSARICIFSSLLPCALSIGRSFSTDSSLMPLLLSSATTPSRPILSILSMATVMSIIFSGSPITSAIPASTLRLLSFIATRMFSLPNTWSMSCTSSTSFISELLPMMSASHW